jgi:hypothetical protein
MWTAKVAALTGVAELPRKLKSGGTPMVSRYADVGAVVETSGVALGVGIGFVRYSRDVG